MPGDKNKDNIYEVTVRGLRRRDDTADADP